MVSAQSIIDRNKIVEIMTFMSQNAARFPIATVDKGLVRFLLSRENRASGDNMLGEIARAKELIQQALLEGNGKTIAFKVRPRFNARKQPIGTPAQDNCTFTGAETDKLISAQLEISNKIEATATFDPRVCAPNENWNVQLSNTFQQLYEIFQYKLYAFVLNELARLKGDGTYKHIGKLPSRNADVPVNPGKVVNVFKADGDTPNKAAVIALQQDLENAGVMQNQSYAWGDELWDSFSRALPGYSQGDEAGFVYSTLRVPFLNQGTFMMNADIATKFRERGLSHPLLILKPGAVQLVTSHEFVSPLFQQNTGDVIKTVITVPGLGIEADLVTRIENCDTYPTWHFKLSVRAALFTLPGCVAEAMSDDFLNDYNGVMLYDGGCGNETFCEQAPFVRQIQDGSVPLQACEDADVVPCGIPETCSVTLGIVYNLDGSILVTANPVPVPPNTVITYAWAINGTPEPGYTTQQIFIPAGGWANDDEFTVLIETSDNCDAQTTIVANSIFATLQLSESATPRPNGASLKKTGAKGAGNTTVTIALDALSDANVEVSAITITDNGGLAINPTTAPTAPVDIVKGATQNIVLSVPNATAGSVVYYITVVSNDPTNPSYELTVEVQIS